MNRRRPSRETPLGAGSKDYGCFRRLPLTVPGSPRMIPRKPCGMIVALTWPMPFLMNAVCFWTFKLSIEMEGPICYHSWEQLAKGPLKAWEI